MKKTKKILFAISLLLLCFGASFGQYTAANSKPLFAPCPATTTKAEIKIYDGDVVLKPCSTKKTVFASGSVVDFTGTSIIGLPSGQAGVQTINGLTATSQTFAIGAADTAAFSSTTSTHTLNLPITQVIGTSRITYLPYFSAANVLTKSNIKYTASTFDMFPASDFRFGMDTSGKVINFGDLTNLDTVLSLNDTSGNISLTATTLNFQGAASFTDAAQFHGTATFFEPASFRENAVFQSNVSFLQSQEFNESSVFNGIAEFIGTVSLNSETSFFGTASINGDLHIDRTISVTAGNATINKNLGTVNFAAGANAIIVTNNRVMATSQIIVTPQNIDTTCTAFAVNNKASGSFQIRAANSSCTAQTSVTFLILN